MLNITWSNGENQYQKYSECEINNDKIVLFANKYEGHNPKLYFCTITKNGKLFTLHNKKKNDYLRKKKQTAYVILASEDLEYMKTKAIEAYTKDKYELN